MTQYSILPQFNQVIVDGQPITIDLENDDRFINVHAIQINGNTVDIEYLDSTPNNTDTLISVYQDIIDQIDTIVNAPPLQPTFQELQNQKIVEITSWMKAELALGFTTNGIKMDSLLIDIQRLLIALNLAEKALSTTMDIVDFDNIVHTNVPLAVVNSIVTELGVHYQTVFQKRQTLRQQVYNATTLNELNNIVW